jgi:hypothetical protein
VERCKFLYRSKKMLLLAHETEDLRRSILKIDRMDWLTGCKNQVKDLAETYLSDSLKILKTSLELGCGEQTVFYRVTAAQLRLLLCDTTRRHNQIEDISLARQVYPNLALHLLTGKIFDLQATPIPLKDWLAQRLPLIESTGAASIRELIRLVCDNEGGVHVDLKKGNGSTDLHREWILRIGDYVYKELESRNREMGFPGNKKPGR